MSADKCVVGVKSLCRRSEYVDTSAPVDHQNETVMYALIHDISGNDDEFAGGEYIAAIILGKDYPAAPPHVRFLTPNGVTAVDTLISINRFGFHNEGYTPEIGAHGVALLLPAVLLQWRELGPGVGLISAPSVADITSFGHASAQYNSDHLPHIVRLFEGWGR